MRLGATKTIEICERCERYSITNFDLTIILFMDMNSAMSANPYLTVTMEHSISAVSLEDSVGTNRLEIKL
jgi:hypothetical protein